MPRRLALDYFLLSAANLSIPLELSFDFRESLSSERRFARTSQDYPSLRSLSSRTAIFLTITVALKPFSHCAKYQNNRTPTKRRGALSSCTSQSTAVAWVWIPAGPCFHCLPELQACHNSGQNRDQTLGLRSVVPSTSSSWTSTGIQNPSPQSHSIMPRCEAVFLLLSLCFSCLLRVPHFVAASKPREPH